MSKQDLAFKSYLQGNNIFITGSGGTGKSYIIKKIYNDAIEKGKNISVTALTGIAAILLECNACTIHSWAGIGLGKGDIDNIIKKVSKSKFKSHNWYNTDILIIDEISMMSNELFELLNLLGQFLLKNKKPFGGIQIIMSGDFFQLPPVNSREFCFENENFISIFSEIFYFKKIYRQSDPKFKKILLNMRLGKITKQSLDILNERIIDEKELENLLQIENITRLVPTKLKANKINKEKLDLLNEENYTYSRELLEEKESLTKNQKNKLDTMTFNEKETEYNYIKNSTLTEEIIELKKNAFVMCIANLDIDNGIVNGSQGIIQGFDDNKNPIVKFKNKTVIIDKYSWKSETIPGITIKQIPLILAWSLTIHKAQGVTLEKVIIDVGNDIFECGQMYVAFSRVKSLEGLYLENFDINKLKISSKVLNFYINNNLII